MTTVGFVGLGNMGGPMARNLVAAGFGVKVFDLVPAMMEGVEGAQATTSALEAASDVDVVVSMLPAGQHVRAVYLGRDGEPGLLDAMNSSTLVIDCSTIDARSAQDVAAAAAQRGISMLDAPVSGGTAGAENGTLTFIVGGEADALERARPCLPTFSMRARQGRVKWPRSVTTCCWQC